MRKDPHIRARQATRSPTYQPRAKAQRRAEDRLFAKRNAPLQRNPWGLAMLAVYMVGVGVAVGALWGA